MSGEPLLRVEGLTKEFVLRSAFRGIATGVVKAVDRVTFDIEAGETLGLVGESGCGKSTTGRLIVGLLDPDGGSVRVNGEDVLALRGEALARVRHQIQIVFQDPFGSLNPRMSVAEIIAEPLRIQKIGNRREARERVSYLLDRVGLNAAHIDRYPHEFSGGQRQRIGIARALSARSRFIVCDEAVSALDVSVQAQVVNLLQDLQEEFGLAYLFIAHDLSVVRHISHRVAVMYLGQVVEIADREALYARPQHPYTQALLAAVPVNHPSKRRRRIRVGGELGSPLDPPKGCRFNPRCPLAQDICRQAEPPLETVASGHKVACHLVKGAAAA